MTNTIHFLGLIVLLPLVLSIGLAPALPFANAGMSEPHDCLDDKVLIYNTVHGTYICTSEDTAERWVKHGMAEIYQEPEDEAMDEAEDEAMDEAEDEAMDEAEDEAEDEAMDEAEKPMWQTSTGTIRSIQDPGIGHETHQLAIILPPSDNVYKGVLSYVASEPIQLVALHGPLADDEDNGQAIWTPDGETKFALTFIDPETANGSWLFTGNALAVHTMNEDEFTVSYSVSYKEKPMSEMVTTGTLTSIQDPGIGHETHQLAIILPPSENTYSGVLTYSASEPIQLVALHGPLADDEDNGQAIWTPDGETKFALNFVDNEASMGTWTFAGNALAVHTMNEDTFTISYSVVAGQ